MTEEEKRKKLAAAYRIGRYFRQHDINDNPFSHIVYDLSTPVIYRTFLKELNLWFEDGWQDVHKEKGYIG